MSSNHAQTLEPKTLNKRRYLVGAIILLLLAIWLSTRGVDEETMQQQQAEADQLQREVAQLQAQLSIALGESPANEVSTVDIDTLEGQTVAAVDKADDSAPVAVSKQAADKAVVAKSQQQQTAKPQPLKVTAAEPKATANSTDAKVESVAEEHAVLGEQLPAQKALAKELKTSPRYQAIKQKVLASAKNEELQTLKNKASEQLEAQEVADAIETMEQTRELYAVLLSELAAAETVAALAPEVEVLRQQLKTQDKLKSSTAMQEAEELFEQAQEAETAGEIKAAEASYAVLQAGYTSLEAVSGDNDLVADLDQAKSDWAALAVEKALPEVKAVKVLEKAEPKYRETLNDDASLEQVTVVAQGLEAQINDYKALTAAVIEADQFGVGAQKSQSSYEAAKKRYKLKSNPAAVQAAEALVVANVAWEAGSWSAAAEAYAQAQQGFSDAIKADKEVVAKQRAAAKKARKKSPAELAAASIKRAMVSIPAGSFNMGSKNGDDHEKPVHHVAIASFSLQSHEVTWEQYLPCIKARVCSKLENEGWGQGGRPVVNVSWKDAQTYIKWLNKKAKTSFRLPTEAEWEYAARAGSQKSYSWGKKIGKGKANCDGCGSQWDNIKTAPVKSFKANKWGVYDMHGNVWEWTQDCYHDQYRDAPSDGSAWEGDACAKRVLRGGSWFNAPYRLRSANRKGGLASVGINPFGFRLAQDN